MTASVATPQSANSGVDATARLAQLKQMHEQALITSEEYAAKRQQILDSL